MGSLYPHYEEENYSSNTANLLNPEEFRRQGHMIIDFIADYYQNMEKYPVLSQVQPGYLAKLLPKSAPNIPEPIETILLDIQQYIIPGITHWQSPNYFAYFPSSGSIAGFLGEVLSTGFNVVGFNWISSPAATELEFVTMDWLGQMLGLPQSFLFSGTGGGVIQGTTCEAILCTLVAARDQMLAKVGRENMGKLVFYGSDQTHCALLKAAKVAGLECKNFRAIKTMRSTAFQLSAESLRTTIRLDVEVGLIPAFLCATIGTTSTTAVDPIRSLSEVTKEYGMWIHVDAAYAGSACICPEYRHFIDGVENVNSFSFNAHKWFFTTLDCCCLWVKDPGALTKSLSSSAEYLKNNASDSKQVVDYKDWQITLSRRFRSMKLWLVLRSYGVENLRNFLRSHVKMAKRFQQLVESDNRFEVVVPRNFAMVCFRVLPTTLKKEPNGCKIESGNIEAKLIDQEYANDFNRNLLETVNASGKVFMTHSIVEGIYVIRFAVGATLTEDKHVIKAWKVVQETVDGMLATI
ncbi:tyrosine decarboxylase [Gossypium raimondii]|uniref:tyrosine decarboxylase n=1 Tax=Gossypium raimondii TaxID=29730 RepID=UPI00227A80EF|nr:tyrosine decarboxylase [Gossypium raimondii]